MTVLKTIIFLCLLYILAEAQERTKPICRTSSDPGPRNPCTARKAEAPPPPPANNTGEKMCLCKCSETGVAFNATVENDTAPARCPLFDGAGCELPPIEAPPNRSSEVIPDPYIKCPELSSVPPASEVLYSTNQRPDPTYECQKCDLRVTDDKKAVVLQCFDCYDPKQPPANRTKEDLVYRTPYVQIANYSSFDIKTIEI